MIQALASGTLDVYVAGVAPLGVARSKGIDIRVVTATAVEEMTVAAGARPSRCWVAWTHSRNGATAAATITRTSAMCQRNGSSGVIAPR